MGRCDGASQLFVGILITCVKHVLKKWQSTRRGEVKHGCWSFFNPNFVYALQYPSTNVCVCAWVFDLAINVHLYSQLRHCSLYHGAKNVPNNHAPYLLTLFLPSEFEMHLLGGASLNGPCNLHISGQSVSMIRQRHSATPVSKLLDFKYASCLSSMSWRSKGSAHKKARKESKLVSCDRFRANCVT